MLFGAMTSSELKNGFFQSEDTLTCCPRHNVCVLYMTFSEASGFSHLAMGGQI